MTIDNESPKPASTWEHPTGLRKPTSVLMVALGPSKGDLLEITTRHQPPADVMECDEVWGINGGVNHFGGRVAYDLLWVMDWIEQEARTEPRYGQYIKRHWNIHAAPIITSQATGEWENHPGVHEYPLQEVLQHVGNDNGYFHNSLPYILAYALYIGVKRFVLFGADYSHERIKRREDDRANAEYWVGYCRAKGMQVVVPATTTLLNTDRGLWFYGYRDQPVSLVRGAA